MSPHRSRRRKSRYPLSRRICAIVVPCGIAVSLSFALLLDVADLFHDGDHLLLQNVWYFIAPLTVVQGAYFFVQSRLWMRYSPLPPEPNFKLPSISVVVAAHNEESMIRSCVSALMASDYPHDKLQVVVVDDGSTDGTWPILEGLCEQYTGRLVALRNESNQGKRIALAMGFEHAKHAIWVMTDADSEVMPTALRALVSPLVHDANIGGVTGRAIVHHHKTFVGRMLEFRYWLSFDLRKAAQSSFRAVSACSGTLSAFRPFLLMPALRTFAEQEFLGQPVRYGEDRALANLVLRSGYDTVYQRTAVVKTAVPGNYKQICRMFARWERSFIVEGIAFAKFMFTPYRRRNRFWPIVDFVMEHLRLVTAYVSMVYVPMVVLAGWEAQSRLLIAFLVAGVSTALFYVITERSLRFVYGMVYAVYMALLMPWIFGWAMLTVRTRK